MNEICTVYHEAQTNREAGGHTISADEITGIQALEHKYPDKPAMPGKTARMEFEYIRHGTTSLIGFFDVATGRMEAPYLKSESLVRFVAEQCGLQEDLGCKGKSGILKSMKSRAEFLQQEGHRIRIVYTPKHCSWMNRIEIWFGIIHRRLLKRKSYKSIEELEASILRFIEQYNLTAKPFKWTYKGVSLTA